MKNERIFIKNWKGLSKINKESKTHILEVDVNAWHGWLYSKNPKPYKKKKTFMQQIANQDVYLSTHTFYNKHYKHSSKVLRACGFNVELDNWG